MYIETNLIQCYSGWVVTAQMLLYLKQYAYDIFTNIVSLCAQTMMEIITNYIHIMRFAYTFIHMFKDRKLKFRRNV